MATIDWNAVYALLPPESPDAYHSHREAGAVKFLIGFGDYEVPAGHETSWDTWDAYCWYCAQPWNQYAFETAVLSHARGIHEIAARILDYRGGRTRELREKKPVDTLGMDLFGEGLLAAVEAIKRRPDFGNIGPDDSEPIDQLKKYVFGAARHKMNKHWRDMYQKWWRTAIREASRKDGELRDEDGNELSYEQTPLMELIEDESHKRAVAAIESACTLSTDERLIELSEEGSRSQEEIGRELGLSRDQVQRDLNRILRTTENLLGLRHGKTVKRKRRKEACLDGDASTTRKKAG